MTKAKFKVAVEVTEKHIKQSRKLELGEEKFQRCKSCPVALGLRSLKFKSVDVGYVSVCIIKKGVRFAARIPGRVSDFICDFDSVSIGRYEVKPIKFNLTFKEVA